MAAKKRSDVTPLIPGFRKVETTLGGFWKPTIDGQHVQGIVGQAVEVKGREDDQRNVFFTLQLTSEESGPIHKPDSDGKDKKIKAERGMIIGVGGKMVQTFLRSREGKEVVLIYRGLGPKKAGQSAPKMYDTYERETSEADE